MILDQKQTAIAYRCPHCGSIVRSVVGIFTLSADMIRLKCPCGESALDLVYTKDKKIRITVPCLVCPSPHSYLISSDAFFSRECFNLACTYTGLDLFFSGTESEVDRAIAEAEAELIELAGDDALEALSKTRGEEDLADPQVLEVIMYVVKELEDEGNIHCGCEDGGEYELQLGDESVFVVCKKCGREYEVKANSVAAAQAFLEADEITLT